VRELHYRLVNVFATAEALSGNPLCVFEDGSGLDERTMQALALQFNLSETTFVTPSTRADARVRIFAPSGEMPFAGHPTLGTAAVLSHMGRGGQGRITLEMAAGLIPVQVDGERCTLMANAPVWRETDAPPEALAAMLGLSVEDLATGARWVSTGNEQLLIPLVSEAALARVAPVPTLASRWANDRGMVKLCCFVDSGGPEQPMRFFFEKQRGVIAEDPGTGSACANLGGWWLSERRPLPLQRTLRQGDHLGRPCRLGLAVTATGQVEVSGRVVLLGAGSLRLPV
jgi:PhzF family phenazine biosynthesis protein